MKGKSGSCNDQLQLQINVGVARHSFVGTTVYGTTLRKHPRKVKPSEVETKGRDVIPTDRHGETKFKHGSPTVTETTAEIVCIVCKDGASARPNEIVLCDKCGIGYHQKCHSPSIEDKALEPEEPWMCSYCTNGSECPYLLNPFETKLQKNLNLLASRKDKEGSKVNYHIPSHARTFVPNKQSGVRNIMANYYHDTYRRRSSMDASHVRHVPREAHHVMSRPTVVEKPRSKFYRYPDDVRKAERENGESRKRRLESQEKARVSKDVWDNRGYTPTTHDVSNNEPNDISKFKGKEGPREKQRLTQDLERQRKKLKEDMKRGQELQREHDQLLTRDQAHDRPRGVSSSSRKHSSEESPNDELSYDSRKSDRRQHGHNGTAEHLGNVWENSEKRARDDRTSTDIKVNGVGSGGEKLNGKLDPCDCDALRSGAGVKEHIHRMSDIQCEHSSSGDNYRLVNGHVNGAKENHEHVRNSLDGHKRGRETCDHTNSESVAPESYTSEKIEVIGESRDVSGCGDTDVEKSVEKTQDGDKRRESNDNKSEYDEYLSVRKERRAKEAKKERSGSVKSDKESLKENSSATKRSSCSDESVDNDHGGGNKGSKTLSLDGGKKQHKVEYESDVTQNRVRSDLPRHNWLLERWINQKNVPGNETRRRTSSEEIFQTDDGLKNALNGREEPTSTDNGIVENSVRPTSASPVFEQAYEDEVIDEGYTERIPNDEPSKSKEMISQPDNEILSVPSPVKHENKSVIQNSRSPEIKYSPSKQSLCNGSPEFKQHSPKSKAGASLDLVRTSDNRERLSPNFIQTSTEPIQTSTSRVSSNRSQATSCITTFQAPISPSHEKARGQVSPIKLPPLSPNRLSSIPNGVTSPPNQISRGRTPEVLTVPSSSPHRLSNCNIQSQSLSQFPRSPSRVTSYKPGRVVSSPNSVPSSSPSRISTGRASTNSGPLPSPIQIPQSPNRIPPSPNRISVSPREKSAKRSSSDEHPIENRQISPRFTPITERDIGGNQGALRTSQDSAGSRENTSISIYPGSLSLTRENLAIDEDDKIIEVSSDGEEVRQGNSDEKTESSRIQTGKSVNPVSPIVRTHQHVMEEMRPGIHEPRPQDLKPQRIPAELPPSIPFMNPAYVSAYSPKTFTPHLITHNASGIHHSGHIALQGGLPGRLELQQHTKPDMNCPFHGKKAEKMHPHVPGYPILPTDARMYPQHPLHENLRDKRAEHPDVHSDPLAMQRRLSAVYDHHMILPHGIPMHHPRCLTPGLIDEHGFPLDSERYKHRLDAAHQFAGLHKPQSYTPGTISVNSSRHAGSPPTEKRQSLKYTEEKRNTAKDVVMQSEKYRQHHHEQSLVTPHSDRIDAMMKRNMSPQGTRSSREEHVPRAQPASPQKFSPSARHVHEAHPKYIQKEKTGPESKPSPSPGTLDQESISRDFNEKFNVFKDRTFKEKLEGSDRAKEEKIAAYRSEHRRLETGGALRAWSENQARGFDLHQLRGVDSLKYRNTEKHSPNAKRSPANSDEQKKLHDRTSPRGLVTSVYTPPSYKPAVSMPPYPFPGSLVPNSLYEYGRGVVGVPMMAGHGDFGVWQSVAGPSRMPGFPPGNATKDAQGLSVEKTERPRPECTADVKREYQEKEVSLAMEKHRMNVAQLENERRKAYMVGKAERIDERRPITSGHERPRPRNREEELRRNWELENRKRKVEQSGSEVNVSLHARAQADMSKKVMAEKSQHMADEMALRKEQYLAMYPRQHEGYAIPGVAYSDRARSASNPPFYGVAEASVTEALRKQRDFNERQEALRKVISQEQRGLVDSEEPAKKRTKKNCCVCGVCGKEASFLCSGCQKAWYCSSKCQHTAWSQHCKECTEVKRR